MADNSGRLKTYQPTLLQELVTQTDTGRSKTSYPASASASSAGGSSWQARKAAQRAALEAQARSREEAQYAAMKRKQQRLAQQREAEFQALYDEVLSGLTREDGILAEVQQTLDHAEAVHHERQSQLYEQWSTQVFDKLQERIKHGMSQTSVQQLEASLKAASDDYIRATNTKLGVFRDVIIEGDYNPLQSLSRSIKVHTDDLVDPLKKDLLKTQAEKALLMTTSSPVSSTSSSGRHTPGSGTLAKATVRPMLEVQEWGEQRINATPYGHCIDKTGNYIVRAADNKGVEQTASHWVVDDYGQSTAHEFYKPSKRVVQHTTKDNMSDLLQHR